MFCLEALKEKLLSQVRQRRLERRGEVPEPTVPLERSPQAASRGLTWSPEDEQQQQEALRSIQLLKRQERRPEGEETERSRREAAQQQVLCLEYELDGKEAALQMAEKHLEQREVELQEAGLKTF